jgi:WD40-like Beta Propeller Repeat
MTSPRRFESDLPALLADLYLAGTPTYRDDLLRQTARVRQRPAWTFPERWLPMELVTTRVPTTRMPWRQIGVLALLVLLIAAAVVGYAASRQTRLPAPFGPAANGLVAYSSGGDIYGADPMTGIATAIVSGPEVDGDPRFSRDGTKLAFERQLDQGRSQVYVAQADGTGLTLVTPEPLFLTTSVLGEHWDRYQFSPDGQTLLIATSENGVPGITIAQSDGSGLRRLNVGMAVFEPSFRPPDGAEILFVGRQSGGTHGLYAIDPTDGVVRPIVEPSTIFDVAGANWSPDGSQIAYWRWGGSSSAEGLTAHTRVVSADGRVDRELPSPPGAVWNAGSEWSNDGTRLFVVRGYTSFYDDVRPVVIPADGSSPGIEIPYQGIVNDECCATWEWAPDDSKILGTPADATGQPRQQVIVDPLTSEFRQAPWSSTSDPAWQRVAR